MDKQPQLHDTACTRTWLLFLCIGGIWLTSLFAVDTSAPERFFRAVQWRWTVLRYRSETVLVGGSVLVLLVLLLWQPQVFYCGDSSGLLGILWSQLSGRLLQIACGSSTRKIVCLQRTFSRVLSFETPLLCFLHHHITPTVSIAFLIWSLQIPIIPSFLVACCRLRLVLLGPLHHITERHNAIRPRRSA